MCHRPEIHHHSAIPSKQTSDARSESSSCCGLSDAPVARYECRVALHARVQHQIRDHVSCSSFSNSNRSAHRRPGNHAHRQRRCSRRIACGSKSTLRPPASTPVGAEKNRCDREAARSSIVRPEDRPGALHTGRVPAVVPLVRHSSVPAVPSPRSKSTRIVKYAHYWFIRRDFLGEFGLMLYQVGLIGSGPRV